VASLLRATRLAVWLLALALTVPVPVARGSNGASVQARVEISPLVVELSLSVDHARVGERVQARATVANLGDVDLQRVTVALRVDHDGIVLQNREQQTLPKLMSNKSGSVMWSLCGRQAGTYVVLASATLGDVSVDSEALLLTITAGRGRPCH
jgi:hypothetical protein